MDEKSVGEECSHTEIPTPPAKPVIAMESTKPRPNVLLIVADQHRADYLGCAGHPVVRTPHMDRMAATGTRYVNCVSSAPLCMPYRCSLQSGLYPFQHGAVDNRGHLELDRLEAPPLAEQFVSAGYQTAYFGKCHWNREAARGVPEYVPPHRRLGWMHWEGWNNGHYSYDMPAYSEAGELIHPWEGLYEPEIMTERAMRYLREDRDPSKPFFMQINWHPPHNATSMREFERDPDCLTKAREIDARLGLNLPDEAFTSYWWFCQSFPQWLMFPVVPEEFLRLYRPDEFKAPPNLNPWYRGVLGHCSVEYAAMITSLDVQLGRLMEFLRESGLKEDTVIIYTSDHGDYLGTHPGKAPFRGKGDGSPESSRVPLIIEGAGFDGAQAPVSLPCNTMDLHATLLDVARIDPAARLRGTSLLRAADRPHCLGSCIGGRSVFDGECPTRWRRRPTANGFPKGCATCACPRGARVRRRRRTIRRGRRPCTRRCASCWPPRARTSVR